MPGQILGDRYEVENQLGKKAGRWTLLARDLTTEAPVILKLVFIDEKLHQDELRLFTREIETLQTLSHPCTPKYLDYFEIDLGRNGKALALVQSYMDGTSIQHYLKSGRRLNQNEAIQTAKAILQILIYLHNHQPPIVHRDIKPSNVLLSNQPEILTSTVYLVDFGSVKSLSLNETTSFTLSLVGTDGYMPPEQMGRRVVRASDLYSLGVTLVTAFTGIEPANLPRRGLRIDFNCIDQSKDFKPAFVHWLKQITEPELDKRFKSAQEALEALNAVE